MKESEALWQEPGHVFARWKDVMVQVRGDAELTPQAIESISTVARLTRAQMPGAPVIGALLVLEERAPAPRGPAIAAQKELFQDIADDPRVHIALVLEGNGLGTNLKRVLVRGRLKSPRIKMFGTVAEGARHLLEAIGEPQRTDALIRYVESIRPR